MIELYQAITASGVVGIIGYIGGKLHNIHVVRSANCTALGEIRRADRATATADRLRERNREVSQKNAELVLVNERHVEAEMRRLNRLSDAGKKGRAKQIAQRAAEHEAAAEKTLAALTSAPPAPREQVVAGVRESRKARAAVG